MASFIEGNPATKGLYGDLKRRMDGTVATFQATWLPRGLAARAYTCSTR